MSIYPVRLSEWFTKEEECYSTYETALLLVKIERCLACRNRLKWKRAVGHHSVAFGHGDIWCSWKCCNSGKIAKPDKRRERKFHRIAKQVRAIFSNIMVRS